MRTLLYIALAAFSSIAAVAYADTPYHGWYAFRKGVDPTVVTAQPTPFIEVGDPSVRESLLIHRFENCTIDEKALFDWLADGDPLKYDPYPRDKFGHLESALGIPRECMTTTTKRVVDENGSPIEPIEIAILSSDGDIVLIDNEPVAFKDVENPGVYYVLVDPRDRSKLYGIRY